MKPRHAHPPTVSTIPPYVSVVHHLGNKTGTPPGQRVQKTNKRVTPSATLTHCSATLVRRHLGFGGPTNQTSLNHLGHDHCSVTLVRRYLDLVGRRTKHKRLSYG